MSPLRRFFRAFVFATIVLMALFAAFQSPALIAKGYPELQQTSIVATALQEKATDIKGKVDQLWLDVAGNDKTSLADRPAEMRNNIDAFLRSQISILLNEKDLLQKELTGVQGKMRSLTATVNEASAYIRMFGLGVLGAVAGLLAAHSARSEQIFGGENFSRSIAGVGFGGFAGLIGYGLVNNRTSEPPMAAGGCCRSKHKLHYDRRVLDMRCVCAVLLRTACKLAAGALPAPAGIGRSKACHWRGCDEALGSAHYGGDRPDHISHGIGCRLATTGLERHRRGEIHAGRLGQEAEVTIPDRPGGQQFPAPFAPGRA